MFENIQKRLLEKIRQIAAFRRRKRMPKNAQKEKKILELEQELLEEIIIESQEINKFESQEIDYDSIIGEFNKEQSEQKEFKTNNMNYIKKKEIIKNLVSESFNEEYEEFKDICFIDSTFDTNYEEINKELLLPDDINDDGDGVMATGEAKNNVDENDDDSDDSDDGGFPVQPINNSKNPVFISNNIDDDMK